MNDLAIQMIVKQTRQNHNTWQISVGLVQKPGSRDQIWNAKNSKFNKVTRIAFTVYKQRGRP